MKLKSKIGAACAIGGALAVGGLVARAQTAGAGWSPMQVLHIKQPGSFALPTGAFRLLSEANGTRTYERRVIVPPQKPAGLNEPFQVIPDNIQSIVIGPAQINPSAAMISSAADLLKAYGFKAPLIETVDGKLTARIHPGQFPATKTPDATLQRRLSAFIAAHQTLVAAK